MNQPSPTSTDRGPKYLGQGRSGPPGVGAVEDGVGAIDRGGILPVAGLAVGTVEAVDGLLQCLVSAGGEQHVQ
jgi:hypothetical protein